VGQNGVVADLRSRVLLDASLARIEDVACRAPRSGPGDEEGTAGITLVVPRRGVFCVHRGSAATTADPNTVLVLGDGYRVSHPADGGDDCTAMRFAPDLVEEALGSAPGHRGLVTPHTRLRVTMLTAALARGQVDALEAEESALGLLACLAPSLSRGATAAPVGALGRRRAERVRALLAADPSAAWRLEGIARAVHCSPFHLARQFRAATGETIARYLTRLRLAVGLERLAAGETELARLAVELGFAHHSHFTARFHAAFGITPSEARTIVTAPPAGAH
jgi:AraC family transcriptional regulator